MKPIFIGYRRGPDNAAAARLHDRLQAEFGDENVFMDVEDIPPGTDFVEYLESTLSNCCAMIVVIGSGWRDSMERLHNEDDWVRLEIEHAMSRKGISVIPLLVDDTEMPRPEELPASLRAFSRRNGVTLRYDDFEAIIKSRLLDHLHKAIGWEAIFKRRATKPAIGAFAIAAILTLILNLWIGDGTQGGTILLGFVSIVICLIGLALFAIFSRKNSA